MSRRSIILFVLALTLCSAHSSAQTYGQQAYLKASNPGAADNFSRSIAASGSTMIVGAPGESSAASGVNGNQADNSLSAAGAAYVFVRDGSGNWGQQAYLKASDPVSGADFGWSVAVSDDTAVVGAKDAGATGVAYVFVRDGAGNWSQQARLIASNAEFDDNFGFSVAVSGDTIVVGAHREDSNAVGINGNQGNNSLSEAGAAYVFTRDGTGNWTQQAYLKASNTGNIDQFGVSVSISGDSLIVGALAESSNATGVNGNQADNSINGAGAAYVFVRDGSGNWTQQAYLKPSSVASSFENFGISVSLSGDSAVIGALSEDSGSSGVNGDDSDNSASGAGAAYVFQRDGAGNWSQQAYLKASNPDANDNFGESVSISNNTIVVGAKNERSSSTGIGGDQSDNSASAAGAAYLFTRDGTGAWSQAAYIKPSNTEGGDIFGFSVAASGDTAVVGALREDSSATGVNGNQMDNAAFWSGAAYAFASIPTYSVGGSVTGLVGNGLVLQNLGGDDKPILSDGPFTFPTELVNGAHYEVSVLSQPTGPDQICSVTPGTQTGTISGSNVTSVEVLCTTNQPPTANDDTSSVDEDASQTIDVAANDTDTDGDLDASSANTSCTACTTPANGALINNIDGTFEYAPDADFFGSDAFVYQICDTDSACDTATVGITIDPVNDPPTFAAGVDPAFLAGTSGPQSIADWPQKINLGPNETQQVDSYSVSTLSDFGGVLSGPAAISAAGELTFSLTGASGTAQLEATLTDDGGTPNGGSDTSSPVAFSIIVADPAADLAASSLQCAPLAASGEPYAYSFVITNNGPDDATGVAASHVPIPGAAVNSITSPACVDTGSAVDCDLDTITAGTKIQVGIEIQAPNVGAQVLQMTTSVVAATGDPNVGNNEDQASVEIVPGLIVVDGFEACTP